LPPQDWLSAPEAAAVAGSRVVTVPRWALLAGSRLGPAVGHHPFGVDRAILIDGPLALSVAKAHKVLGWRPERTSAQVLADALARGWHGLPLNRER